MPKELVNIGGDTEKLLAAKEAIGKVLCRWKNPTSELVFPIAEIRTTVEREGYLFEGSELVEWFRESVEELRRRNPDFIITIDSPGIMFVMPKPDADPKIILCLCFHWNEFFAFLLRRASTRGSE